jgi:hypothetical protein
VGAGEDFGLDAVGLGDGDAFSIGFTGPVGLSGGAGFAEGVGLADGVAARIEIARQTGSAKMNRRNLMGSCGAASLDDALRVAKNFRMSEHRPWFGTAFSL